MWKNILAVIVGMQIGYSLYDDFDPASLKGKRVLVTGASSGIGEQIAYEYAKFGADVLITARRENVLKQVATRMKQLGRTDGRYDYIKADMSNISDITCVIEAAERQLGGIDVLVLNHITVLPLGEWTGTSQNMSALQLALDVNFKAYVYLASSARQLLERKQGHMIVVSSLAGKIGIPFVAPYSSTKFALDGFFSSWRQELRMRKSNVSITLCVIGLIGTESAMHSLQDFGQSFLLRMVKPASPRDAAEAIIKGGFKRLREVHFPYFDVRLPQILRDWIPEAIEYALRMITMPSHFK